MDPAFRIRHHRVPAADGVTLHVAVTGEGPPVLLLHGFPENWRSWDLQVPAIAAAGLSAWAPDLRGYNLSDRPRRRSAYRMPHLVADAAALIRATGEPRAHVVGHDWGGVIAWSLAARHPELLNRLVILNAPNPRAYARELRRGPQLLRSWYAGFFQLPWLPERLLAAGHFAAVHELFRRTARREGAFSDGDIDARVAGLSGEGALTAALNYYRANRRLAASGHGWGEPVDVETLVIWGEQDPTLSLRLLEGLESIVPGVRVHRLRNAGHWVHRDEPAEVNRLLAEFLCG